MPNNLLDIVPNELTNAMAHSTEFQALQKTYETELLKARIEATCLTIIAICIALFLYRWLRDTRQHLKLLADASRLTDATPSAAEPSNTEHEYPKYRAAKQPIPDSQAPEPDSQKQASKAENAQLDFSTHPDSRYMPKN